MDETILVTNERETDHQAPSQATPKMPSVEVFKEIVMQHCRNWDVSNVDDLCTSQTQTLIEELAQHFH